MDIIRQLEAEQAAKIEQKRKLPEFQPGDTVRVNVRVTEGNRTRVQAYEGVVIARSGSGFQENFTVRKISYGEGVERVFPLYSPMIEGVDQRVIEARGLEEVSIGDFILSGGEPAALVLLDAVVRLLPGVMGNEASGGEESFEHGLLEHPHYTRPQEFEGLTIPEVLTSGNHAKIAAWRRGEAERLTAERRPDLFAAYEKARETKKDSRKA